MGASRLVRIPMGLDRISSGALLDHLDPGIESWQQKSSVPVERCASARALTTGGELGIRREDGWDITQAGVCIGGTAAPRHEQRAA